MSYFIYQAGMVQEDTFDVHQKGIEIVKHRILHLFDKSLYLISQALAPHTLCPEPLKGRTYILHI